MSRFSTKIRSWLEANRHSGYTAAPLLEVSHQTVHNWARGRSVPMRPTRPRIARVLGISEAELDQAIEAELEQIAHAPKASQDGAA